MVTTNPKAKVVITAPNMQMVKIKIIGTTPYVQNKMSARVLKAMRDTQAAGSIGYKGKKREPKDFELLSKEATHVADAGWYGIPASAFRCGVISACRLVGFQMTLAKLTLTVVADGWESDWSGRQPLIKITKGKPEHTESVVRNDSGVADIRPRPMWREGWEAVVTMRFDADQFTVADVTNLVARMGEQVGIGAGRMDSKDSTGMGWGGFRVATKAA